MKALPFFTLFVIIYSSVYSQEYDAYKNQRFFNITKFSYISIQNATFDEYIEDEGTTSTDLPTDDARAYSLQTIGGYFLNPNFSLGAGVGLDGYHSPDFNTMPLFVDLRGYFVNSKNSAFVFLDFGTLIKASSQYRKGRMLEVGFGYKIFVSSNIAMVGSINGSFKGLSLTNESYITADRTVVLRGVGASIGFIF